LFYFLITFYNLLSRDINSVISTMSSANTAMLFKYELDENTITFKGNVTTDGHAILIGYEMSLNGVFVNKSEPHEILSSKEESKHRMYIAAKMFSTLNKLKAVNKQKDAEAEAEAPKVDMKSPKKQCVSFSNEKQVQDYTPDVPSLFFPSIFESHGGSLDGEVYVVALDEQVAFCPRLQARKKL
jgi:hypothetical protein